MVATGSPGMITRTLPQKATELGRIRIGDREPNKNKAGTHPHKLSEFRLTSASESRLKYAADLYGGEVTLWDDDWAPHDEYGRPIHYELYTTTNHLKVWLPTFRAISLSYETWSAAGCQRRCTGSVIVDCPLQEALVGQPCLCPVDEYERADLAKEGKACLRILRLNVQLPDVPGIGVWRLETKGNNATAELMGTLAMLEQAGQAQTIIEGTLYLEQRVTKRPGKGEGKGTLYYAVPVFDPQFTPRQIMTGARQSVAVPSLSVAAEHKTLPEHMADIAPSPQETDSRRQRINDLLHQHGIGPEGMATYWRFQQEERHYDLTDATILDTLYQNLLTKDEKWWAAAQEQARKSRQDAQGATPVPEGVLSHDLETTDSQDNTEEQVRQGKPEDFGD
jgi:hypothetical protein